jgi:hypothetical protein
MLWPFLQVPGREPGNRLCSCDQAIAVHNQGGFMLSHIVVFWLKDDLSDAQRSEFRQGLESLKAIEHTRGVYIGTPAGTGDRPVIDSSYSLAVTVLFDKIQDHDAYQIHPLHQAFVRQFGPFWSRVLIYDYE